MRRVRGDYPEICSRPREFADRLKQEISHAAEIVCVHEIESLSQIDTGDDELGIMLIPSGLAIKRDDLLVIIECAFRPKPANDSQSLHLVTTNGHELTRIK